MLKERLPEPCGRVVPQGTVQALAVVEHFDPLHDRGPGLRTGGKAAVAAMNAYEKGNRKSELTWASWYQTDKGYEKSLQADLTALYNNGIDGMERLVRP